MTDLPAVLLSSLERAPWGWVIMVTVAGYLIKAWPVLQLQAMNARKELRGEHKTELDDCKSRLDAFDKRLTAATNQIHQLDLKLVGTVAAYRILADHTEANDPDSEALAQARAVFRVHWDGTVTGSGIMT